MTNRRSAMETRRTGLLAAAFAAAACGPPPRELPPPEVPTGEFVLAENLPPPAEAAPLVTRSLAELVPEGAAAVPDRAFDEDGAFACLETIEALPPDESPGCPEDGYLVRARILFATDRHGSPERPRLVETPFVEHLEDCGAERERLFHPERRFLDKRFRGVVLRIPTREEPPQLSAAPCRDARLAFEHPGDVDHVLDGLVHRFTSTSSMADVRLLAGGEQLRSWIVGPEPYPDPCAPEGMLAVPWVLEVELLCSGDAAQVTAGVRRRRSELECRESDAPTASDAVRAMACDLDVRAGEDVVTSGYERFRVDLADGTTRDVEMPEVTVSSSTL